ncbi:MAG: hypothetical protein DDT40_01896 [candidate division WS2 bacterium]|nr:hypothetical protein [Candidatus Psychracetigena formicireducens]
MYVGFTELRTSLTEPLKYMPREAKDIRLEFFHAKFSLTELRSLEIKLQESFIEGFTKKEAEILSDADDIILREKLRKEFEEKVRERNEKRVVEIPINLTGVNVQNNGLIIGLSVIKPQYIKAIRQVIGEEVPIEFLEGDFETDNMRHSRIRPLVGGIKIGDSTLGFRAIDRNRVLGFVMTGHAGWEGATVWQPAHSWWQDNRVGTIAINPHLINVRHSDAAFVRLNPGVNIRASIWGLGDIVEWRYSNLTPPGIIVLMDGMMSGTTAGVIHSRGISIQMGIESPFGWVHNQVLAAYSSQGGDSGGPVSSLEDPLLPFQVVLYGIHVGMRRSDNLRIYSPVAGIERDLGVHWGGLGW